MICFANINTTFFNLYFKIIQFVLLLACEINLQCVFIHSNNIETELNKLLRETPAQFLKEYIQQNDF